jgi:hypothetical protein
MITKFSTPHVTTNNHIRPLHSWVDLDEKRQDWFDYLNEEQLYDDRFVKYRGEWYDVMDTQRLQVLSSDPDVRTPHQPFGFSVYDTNPLARWDSIATESFYSGIVFRWPTEEEVYRYDLYSDRYGYIIVGRWTGE